LVEAIKNNGLLVCADGQYYHEWTRVDAIPLCPQGHKLEEFKAECANEYSCDSEACPSKKKKKQTFAKGTTLYGCRTCDNFDLCAQCVSATKSTPRYISTAPDIEGQDDEPGSLNSGMCERCGLTKEQHKAKGQLSCVDLSYNELHGDGFKHISEMLRSNVSVPQAIFAHDNNSRTQNDMRMSCRWC
jgi:hypothetical protein